MIEQQVKRGPGRPRKGKEVRRNVTRSFSPEMIRALDQITHDQSEFIETWMWQHPKMQAWLKQQEEGSRS